MKIRGYTIKPGAALSKANLSGADLFLANLSGADLYGANLYRANLSEANLSKANLYGANLSGANLYKADLSGAYLSGANLSGADLSEANLMFFTFPSIKLISSIHLHNISDQLTLELMRRDAFGHPFPEKFDIWANETNGDCPYQNEDRMWLFTEKKVLWEQGDPTMRDSDLILQICKEQGWKINGHN